MSISLILRAAMLPPTFSLNPEDYALFTLFVPLVRAPHSASLLSIPQQLAFFIGAGAVQALAVTGALFFRKAAMLKTLVLGVGLCIATALLCAAAGARFEVIFAWWLARRAPADAAVHGLNFVLWVLLPLLLWGQTYRHLREKELT